MKEPEDLIGGEIKLDAGGTLTIGQVLNYGAEKIVYVLLNPDGSESEFVFPIYRSDDRFLEPDELVHREELREVVRAIWNILGQDNSSAALLKVARLSETAINTVPAAPWLNDLLAELHFWHTCALYYLDRDDTEAAVSAALEYAPTNPFLLNLLAEFLAAQGDSAKALEEYKYSLTVLSESPFAETLFGPKLDMPNTRRYSPSEGFVEAAWVSASISSANILASTNRLPEAEDILNACLARYPHNHQLSQALERAKALR